MITSIIQILAIALLSYALYRETKRDRLNELRKREELQDLFREQEKTFHTKLGSVTSSIKAQVELTYAEQHDRLVESMKILSGMVGQNTSELAQYKQMVQASRKCVSDNNVMLSQIRTIITDVNHASNIIHQELQIISKPLTNLIETKKQNLIKEGEANRTLRRRIQEKDAVLASTRQSLKAREAKISELNSKLTETLNNARIGFDFLAEELSVIRDWMDDRGVPSAPLKKHLSLYFKGRVPSEAYKRVQSENALKDQLSETISHLSAGIKMEENAPVPDIPGNPGVQGVVNN